MTRLTATFSLIACLVAGCSTAKKDNTEDWNRLQGRWKVDQALKSGHSMEDITYIEVKGDEMDRITTSAKYRRRIRINSLADPHTVDFEVLDEKDKGHVMAGIYKFDKEGKLWICHAPIGKPRPHAFVSTPDDGNVVAVMRSIEPQKEE